MRERQRVGGCRVVMLYDESKLPKHTQITSSTRLNWVRQDGSTRSAERQSKEDRERRRERTLKEGRLVKGMKAKVLRREDQRICIPLKFRRHPYT